MIKCLLCGAQIKSTLSLTFLMTFKAYRDSVICDRCRNKFRMIKADHCCKDCCKAGDFRDSVCPDCVRWRRVTGTRFKNCSMYQYNSMMSEYMHRYKFMGDYRLRYVFQLPFSRFVTRIHRLMIPIPLHQNTYRQRGFNQVEGLLRSQKMIKILRTRHNQKTVPQSHKSRADRLRLAQPFYLLTSGRNEIDGKDVAVVDDVYTTGTTIRHAARLLKQAGARSVIGITLAR